LAEYGFFRRKRKLLCAVSASKILSINDSSINADASAAEIKFASASLLSGDSEFPSPEEYFLILFARIRNEDNIYYLDVCVQALSHFALDKSFTELMFDGHNYMLESYKCFTQELVAGHDGDCQEC
jgi:hypothetical protein